MATINGHQTGHEDRRKRINSELLVALGFNLAAWLVVGAVAWTLIN